MELVSSSVEKSSPYTYRGAWLASAEPRITSRALPSASVTTGTPGLMIPAFWAAMASMVFPSRSVCSRVTLVITETSGVMMLVESHRPPMPTSITA